MKNKVVFRRILVIAGIAGIGLLLASCSAGYVATQPSYIEHVRPARPSNSHVWIDGDWSYNRQTRVYIQQEGYWAEPRTNRIFISGQWQATPKGKHWNKGHWQKKEREENRHNGY